MNTRMQVHKYAKMLVDSMLFDSAFYIDECSRKEINLAGISPVIHYLANFADLNINPHPLFDSKYYCEQLPNLKEELFNPLIHYITTAYELSLNPHPLFDTKYYRKQVKDIELSKLTPLGHFLAIGANEFINPNYYFDTKYYCQQLKETPIDKQLTLRLNPLLHFILVGANKGLNPSPKFNTLYYLKQNPDVARSDYNALEHFILFGKDEGRAHFQFFSDITFKNTNNEQEYVEIDNTNLDLYETLDLEQIIADYKLLRQHEPLLPVSTKLDNLQELRMPTISQAGKVYQTLANLINKPFSHLFLMPFLLHGGAEKVSMNLVKCVADKLGSDAPLVLITDTNDISALEWLAQGVRLIVLDDLCEKLNIYEKELIVSRLILQSQPQAVTNINSAIGWNVYKKFGKQLSTVTNLTAGLFGYGFDNDNVPDGLAIYYLNHSMDYLHYLFSDTERFRSILSDQFGFSSKSREKQVTLYSPMSNEPNNQYEFAEPRISQTHQDILWASRLSPGKRPDILLKIARALPNSNFHVWGKADHMPPQLISDLKSQKNIILYGKYDDFFKIPFNKCGIFLYTTEGDGIPLVLLESIACGFPIIAPNIGGIPELIGPNTGWLIDKCDDVEAYKIAISEILNSPDTAKKRVLDAQKLVQKRHSWSSFVKQMNSLSTYWTNGND